MLTKLGCKNNTYIKGSFDTILHTSIRWLRYNLDCVKITQSPLIITKLRSLSDPELIPGLRCTEHFNFAQHKLVEVYRNDW